MGSTEAVVFRNGRVFRADAGRTCAEAIAVSNGVIVAVGGDAEVADFMRTADEVVDLDGRSVLPGFIDAHAHPVQGGLELGRCDLSGRSSADEYAEAIAHYLVQHPNRPWVVGGGWSLPAFPGGRPSSQLLDAVVGDRPAYFINRDHHSAWVSGAALRLADIDARTADPRDGRIERDSDGAPTGLLHEGAIDLVARLLPPPDQQEYDDGLRRAQAYLHSLGIVGWQDALVDIAEPIGPHSTYLRAAEQGWLTARVEAALWWDRGIAAADVETQIGLLSEVRRAVAEGGHRYRADTVKVMQDGVAETFTAGLLEPYLDRCGHPTDNRGLSFLSPELLNQVVTGLDRAGFGIHFHALGDRAVREVLDALTHARSVNGTSDRRHQLAHLQIVHPDDIPRFRAVGAIANLQPLWACHEPQMDELTIPFLGARRAGWQYPFAALQKAGAALAMGSDWPVSSPDPLLGIQTAVTRLGADAPDGTPPLDAAQALGLADSLVAYTAGSAFAAHRESGLSVGSPADIVVLDRDLFGVAAGQIHTARVHRTYVRGQLVHSSE
ncbi:amidohydrolase [uncultured Jatrophihabitans sp.]|uniref:amidohydrolase n=1 Tax=uncultured Jatrophihabitans sp. TaxID=1610747 RepID=UPI0035CC0226